MYLKYLKQNNTYLKKVITLSNRELFIENYEKTF